LSASSDLVKSISFTVSQNGDIEFEFNESGLCVDKGRRKGAKMPPIKPIEQWIKKRGLDLNAFAVAKNISKNGIRKYPWIYTSFPDPDKPNSKASRDLELVWEEILMMQLEYDIDQLET
jgi:hypothetical protein